jgi:transcriptional regulator with XRE-family HTH domain
MAAVSSIAVLRAARILANLSQQEVAQRAGIGRHTLMRLESGDEAVGIGIVERVHSVLERAGVEFLPATQDSGPGIRLRKN